MSEEDPTIAVARATRDQRGKWAAVLVALAVVVAIAGVVGWQASQPSDLQSAAAGTVDALTALQCSTDGTGCDAPISVPHAQTMWLYAGGAGACALLLVAFLLLATRPAVPRSASARRWPAA